jgi:hypothetical protein
MSFSKVSGIEDSTTSLSLDSKHKKKQQPKQKMANNNLFFSGVKKKQTRRS